MVKVSFKRQREKQQRVLRDSVHLQHQQRQRKYSDHRQFKANEFLKKRNENEYNCASHQFSELPTNETTLPITEVFTDIDKENIKHSYENGNITKFAIKKRSILETSYDCDEIIKQIGLSRIDEKIERSILCSANDGCLIINEFGQGLFRDDLFKFDGISGSSPKAHANLRMTCETCCNIWNPKVKMPSFGFQRYDPHDLETITLDNPRKYCADPALGKDQNTPNFQFWNLSCGHLIAASTVRSNHDRQALNFQSNIGQENPTNNRNWGNWGKI